MTTASYVVEEAIHRHLRVVTDWTRPREVPVEDHLLDELARDIATDVRKLIADELHQQAAKWHATCAPYKSHYAIAWDDAVDFLLAHGQEASDD